MIDCVVFACHHHLLLRSSLHIGIDEKDETKVIARESSDDAPFSALAFKIMNDPFVGKLLSFTMRLIVMRLIVMFMI